MNELNQSIKQKQKRIEINIYLFEIKMSSSILKYGQIIRFCSYEAAMANPNINNTFITSKSYTDQNIYFQVYNSEDRYLTDVTTINIPNYRESLFEVLPTSSFQINDEMNEKGQKKELQRAKTQQQQFKAMISQKRGKYISFGDKVVFKHVDSQYYMSGSIDCAPSGIGAFKIKLRKELSEKNVFMLRSYRTYEKQGDQISINAPFRIYHCETQCYVSYCFERLFVDKQFFTELNFKQDLSQSFVEYPEIKNSHYIGDEDNIKGYGENQQIGSGGIVNFPIAGRFEIINENIQKRVFRLVLHNQFEMKPNKQSIKNHDIVFFIHTKDDKYLCCNNFKQAKKSGVFLKKRKNQTDLDHIFDGLWEIQEIKTIDERTQKYDDALSKSRTPNPKKTLISQMGINSSINVSANRLGLPISDNAFLQQTVTPNLQTGALGVGVLGDEQETTTKSKSKKKYIVRHLISGRIMFITDGHIVKVQTPDSRRKQKPVLLESVQTNLVDGSLVQFAHKTTEIDERKGKKVVKYFLQIQEQEGQKKKKQYSIEMNENEIEQASKEEEFMSEENSQIMEQNQIPDQIKTTYDSFFQINQLKMTIDSSQHGFRVYKIDEEIKQLALFVLSSQQILYKFCLSLTRLRLLGSDGEGQRMSRRLSTGKEEMKQEFQEDLNVAVLNNVINVLRDLIGFIYDCEYSMIAESGNNPNSKKQRIFDELGMIELLTRLVEIIDRYDDNLQKIVPKDRSEYKKVRNIYVLTYNLLESIAANNYIQKIKISKYLDKYLNQLKKQDNKVVYRSIQEVLDGNYLALERKVQESYIDQLIKKFQVQNPDPADLYFLSRLCLCGDKTVLKNQNAVYKSFYQTNEEKRIGYQEQTVAANKFKFREDQQKMQILSKIANYPPQYRTLSQLYEQCRILASQGGQGNSDNPDKGHWNYFLQYLNLLADICVDQNATPLQYILDNLPLKTLVAFLHQSTVKKKLLFQPFIRLVHHAFVETKKFEKISKITKVKEWDLLGNYDIPKSSKFRQIQDDIKKTMKLMMDYIRRINKKPFALPKTQQKQRRMDEIDQIKEVEPDTIDFDPQNKQKLYNVKTFLQILKSTLNLGFWQSMEVMKKMVPYMLKVMKFDYEYAQKKIILAGEYAEKQKIYQQVKQQLTLNKPNIVLLVECKILAAQILSIIIDYEFNVRVSTITKHFKDVMENDVDLSNFFYDAEEFRKKWENNKQYQFFEPLNQKQGYLLNEELWKQKVDEIISEGNIFQYCSQQLIDESLTMFETFVYENQHLTNLTFEILNRITNQRRQILKTFKDIIFVAGGNLSNLAKRGVTVSRSVLLNLNNSSIKKESITSTPNLLWQVVRTEGGRQFIINRQLKPLGAIQQLAFLTMAMMKNGNPTLQRASRFYKATDLYPFKELLYDDIDYEQNGSYLVITQKDQNLPLNQNLIKSQDHHLKIIDFIKIMSDIRQDQQKKDQMKPLPRRALHAAYNFLTVLVWNHNENKKQLQDLLRISECHLKFNVGTIDFYKEMYKNNMKLVKKSQISRIVHHIIDLVNNTDIRLYQKSKLMDFLRIIVIFDNQGYDVNQNIVMEIISQYQVSSKNQIVLLNTDDELSKRIEQYLGNWINTYQQSYFRSTRSYQDLNVGAELFYLATFFEIFSALIQNENIVNIGKCTNMHPLEFLLNMLEKAQHCWPLIRHLRSYVNKLYYFDGREKDTSLFDMFINKDLKIIRNQLRGIVELACNTPLYNEIKIKNPIRYAYLGSYIFLSLEQILHSLDLMFENKDFFSYMTMLISQVTTTNNPEVTYTILQIIEMDEYLQKTIDGRYINKYLEKVSKNLKKIVANIPFSVVQKFNEMSKKQMAENMKQNNFGNDDVLFKKNYFFHQEKGLWRHLIDWNSFKQQSDKRSKLIESITKYNNNKDQPQSKEAELQKKRDAALDYIYLANIEKKIQKVKAQKIISLSEAVQQGKMQEKQLAESNLPKNLTTSMSSRFKVKKQRFQNTEVKNNVINNRRKKLVKFIQLNQEFSIYTNQQTNQRLYNIFANLNQRSLKCYQSNIVGNADVIKAIVKMNQNDPNFIKPQYKLMVVQLLTNYVQRCAPQVFKKDIQDWELKTEDLQSVRTAQNFLNQCGCAKFLCSLIVNDLRSDIKMGNSILKFGTTLLLGQNKDNQSAVFEILKQDEKNILITELQNLIKNSGTSIATHVFGKKEKQISSKINYSDTYDYFNDHDKSMTRKFFYVPETVEQQKQFNLKLIALQQTFIFLRVLCEGNNEIKNFIREQITNDEQKKVKNQSVNFIELGVNEIKRMFLKFNIANVKVPFSIINFIIEVTQIPCISNQLFLCESSFFHDFANLEIQISRQLQTLKISPNIENIKIINKLYSLCINNVISCLEGNKRKIYNFLASEDLSKFFVQCLSFYVKYLPMLQRSLEEKQPHQEQKADQIKCGMDLKKYLDRNKLHSNYFLDLFQVTSVIIKLMQKLKDHYYKIFASGIEENLKLKNMKECFELLRSNLLGIQIAMDDYESIQDDGEDRGEERNQILFFPRHAVYNYLSRLTRSRIMEQINRSTQRDKIIGLFNTTHQISEQIDYNYYLDNQYCLGKVPVSISNQKIMFYQNLGMYIAALICFLMILWSDVIYYPYEHSIEYDLGPQSTLVKIISYVQFLVAVVFCLLWLKNHLFLALGKYQEDQNALAQEGIKTSGLLKLFFRIPYAKEIYCLATYDQQFSTIMMYMFGSAMGCFYSMEWFSLLLFNLMMQKMDVLKNILMAITTNLKMLGMLSLLGISFISIFSIFSIHYYASSLYPQSIPKQHCESLTNCIIELYIREQIGEDMDSFETGRFVSDMLYTIFMDLLFGNIVGGVLIDTFAELRQRGDEIEQDKKGKCFICGIEKETLQKTNQDLKTHYQTKYHKLWNYVFYIYYLNKQQKKTGLEIIIQEKIQSENVSWIPNSSSDTGDISEKIQELEKLIQEQKEMLGKIETYQ